MARSKKKTVTGISYEEFDTATFNHLALYRAMEELVKVANKTVQMPILQTVRIQVAKMEAKLSVTDLDVSVECFIPNVEGFLDVRVNASKLKILLEPDDKAVAARGRMLLSVEDNQPGRAEHIKYLKINVDGLATMIEVVNEDDAPVIPEVSADECLPLYFGPTFYERLKWLMKAASCDETRYNLNGIVIQPSKGRMAATDGHRLHMVEGFDLQRACEIDKQDDDVIMSNGMLEVLLRAMKKYKTFSLSISKKQINDVSGKMFLITTGDEYMQWRIMARELEGQFPEIDQVIPDASNCSIAIEVNSQLLKKALVRFRKLYGKQSANSTLVEIMKSEESVKLSAHGDLTEDPNDVAIIDIPAERLKGEDKKLKIGFNREYALDAFDFKGANEELMIRLEDNLSPIRISPAEGCVAVVMPVRID